MPDKIIAATLQLDSEAANKSVKTFRQDLRDANESLLQISKNFGPTSDEAIKAAQKVGQLKNQIADAGKLANAFNTDGSAGMQAFGGAVRSLAGGFSALTGVMALMGNQSKDVEQAILKVQAALAISEGVNSIVDATKQFKNLGAVIKSTAAFQAVYNTATKIATAVQSAFGIAVEATSIGFKVLRGAIISTGIGALIVGIGFLIEKIIDWTSRTDDATQANLELESVIKKLNQTLDDNLNKIKVSTQETELILKKAGATDKELFTNKISGLLDERQAIIKHNVDLRAEGKLALADRQQLADKENEITIARLQFETDMAVKGRQQAIQNAQKKKAVNEAIAKEEQEAYQKRRGLDTGIITAADMQADLDEKALIDQAAKDAELERQRKLLEGKTGLFAVYFAQLKKDSEDALERDRIIADNNIKVDEMVFQNKMELLLSTSNALNAFSNLVGQQTLAGKILGIASATINTFVGATEVLRAKSLLPEPIGTIVKIANVAAIIATGLSAIRNIAKVQVPGGGGGSAPNISAGATAPLAPKAQTTNTILPQDQLNQIGNAAAVRAFVIEADVTNNQEKISRLNRAARLGG